MVDNNSNKKNFYTSDIRKEHKDLFKKPVVTEKDSKPLAHEYTEDELKKMVEETKQEQASMADEGQSLKVQTVDDDSSGGKEDGVKVDDSGERTATAGNRTPGDGATSSLTATASGDSSDPSSKKKSPKAIIKSLRDFVAKQPKLVAGAALIIILLLVVMAVAFLANPGGVNPAPTPTPLPVTPTPLVTTIPPTTEPSIVLPPINYNDHTIAFLREGDIWIVYDDGSGEVQITQADSTLDVGEEMKAYFLVPNIVTDFRWSPKEPIIALISGRNLWVINLQDLSRNVLTLADEGSGRYLKPMWSPNGKMIAVEYRYEEFEELNKPIERQYVEVYDKNGDFLYRINEADYFARDENTENHFQLIDWFANNSQVLVYRSGEANLRGMWRISLDKVQRERVIDINTPVSKNEIQADLSPDGKFLVYMDTNQAWLLEISTSNKDIIAEPSGIVQQYRTPLYSPNEKKISFEVTIEETNQLYMALFDVDSGSLDLFWSGLYGTLRDYDWGLHGQQLVFCTSPFQESEQTTLWVMQVNTKEQFQVTTNTLRPRWFPIVE